MADARCIHFIQDEVNSICGGALRVHLKVLGQKQEEDDFWVDLSPEIDEKIRVDGECQIALAPFKLVDHIVVHAHLFRG